MRIVLASSNKGKVREFVHAFEGSKIKIDRIDDPSLMAEIIENGKTYLENAFIKARSISAKLGVPVMADDSGIEISALPGEFAVKSARHAGARPYGDVNADILKRLAGKTGSERACRYVAAIAYVNPVSGEEQSVEKTCEGVIHQAQAGEAGFGFDPIFFLPEYGKTRAEIPLDLKNKISHRAKAITAIKEMLLGDNK